MVTDDRVAELVRKISAKYSEGFSVERYSVNKVVDNSFNIYFYLKVETYCNVLEMTNKVYVDAINDDFAVTRVCVSSTNTSEPEVEFHIFDKRTYLPDEE